LSSVRVVDDLTVIGSSAPPLRLVPSPVETAPAEVVDLRDLEAGSSALTSAQRAAVRIFDLALVTPALLLALPVMLIVGLAVLVSSKGAVIHSGTRVTRDGVRFKMYKFRSMHQNGDQILAAHFAENPEARLLYERDRKLRDDPRLTAVGRVIRRWSLDELPQLFNVLVGHMSVVGPRPMLLDEVDRFGAAYATVVKVKGGLTGLWQVSGRSLMTFDDRVPLDVRYVSTRSIRSDFRIVLRTVWHFIRGCPGAY